MSVATDRHEKTRLLFERHVDELYRFIQSLAPNDIDPKDIVQDTFIHVFKSLHQLRDDAMARAWLYRIARNHLYDVMRRRRMEIRYMQFQPREFSTQGIDSSLEVLDAIKSLPFHYQQVLYLHGVKGFRAQEISVIISKTPTAVRIMLHRAKKALANQLGLHDTDSYSTNTSKGGS